MGYAKGQCYPRPNEMILFAYGLSVVMLLFVALVVLWIRGMLHEYEDLEEDRNE